MATSRARQALRWREALILAGLTAALGGCAQLPDWFPGRKSATPMVSAPPAVPPPTVAQPKPPRRPLRHAEAPEPPAEVAMIEPRTLVGLKPPAVARLLGAPKLTSKDEMSLVWTYAADGCALRVYFYPDLKTADFHVLKFTLADDGGKPLGADAPCRRKLLALKTNDSG